MKIEGLPALSTHPELLEKLRKSCWVTTAREFASLLLSRGVRATAEDLGASPDLLAQAFQQAIATMSAGDVTCLLEQPSDPGPFGLDPPAGGPSPDASPLAPGPDSPQPGRES